MCQNAAAAARRGQGSDLLAQALARLQAMMGSQTLQLHLIGNLAGSIVLGHLQDWCGRFACSNLHPMALPRIPVDREDRTGQATHGSFDLQHRGGSSDD